MQCEHYIKWIDRLLADDLPPEQRRELEEHLAQCPACRREKERLEQMMEDVRALETSVPDDLHGQIMAAVEQEEGQRVVQRPHRSFRPYFTLFAAVAAALLLVAGGAFGDLFPFLRPSGEQESADQSQTAEQPAEENSVQINAGQQQMAPAGEKQVDAAPESAHTITIEGRTVELPSQVLQEQYGFYALVCYADEAPAIDEGTALYAAPDGETQFYTIANNITELEKITSRLAQEGYGVFLSESGDTGIGSGQAEHGLIIVSKETRES